jgi:rRNA small subunit pseudouridine methyltransferase Nep1
MLATIIFFDSALELIPEKLRKHRLIKYEWKKSVKKKKRGILLDGAIHRTLVESLEDAEKRGRPDIIHHALMNICFTPLFKQGKAKIIIHTRNNLCIRIPNEWRVPVNYNRFCGLFSQLLLNKKVPLSGSSPILVVERCSLSQILQKLDSDIFLCEVPNKILQGSINITSLSEISDHSSMVFLIGGFQHGEANIVSSMADDLKKRITYLPLYEEVIPAWVVAAKIINWLEERD